MNNKQKRLSEEQEIEAFKKLTLWEALGLILLHPEGSLPRLWNVLLNRDTIVESASSESHDSESSSIPSSSSEERWKAMDEALHAYQEEQEPDEDTEEYPLKDDKPESEPTPALSWSALMPRRETAGIVLTILMAIIFAALGGSLLRDAATDLEMKANNDLNGSTFWFWIAGFTYLMVVAVQSQTFKNWVRTVVQDGPRAGFRAMRPRIEKADQDIEPVTPLSVPERFFAFFEAHSLRFALLPVALIFSWFAYDANVRLNEAGQVENIVFTGFGFFSWVMAIALWYIVLSIDLNGLLTRIRRRGQDKQSTPFEMDSEGRLTPTQTKPEKKPRPQKYPNPPLWQRIIRRLHWTTIVLFIIVLIAGYFRLHDLDSAPPDMTSDHMEKLIDAVKVSEGTYAVFFENNGGREAFQMYVVAAIAEWFDVGYTFRALKYATVLEGLLTVILAFYLGKTLIGHDTPERTRLGNWVGLSMAGLLAISSWHTMLSRLGLRIALTPLTAMLVGIFLTRAIRHNRRIDYVNLGLILGFGMYFYQSNRMLPLLVVAMVGLAGLIYFIRDVLQNRVSPTALRYGFNLAAAGILTLVIYLPMYRYSQEFADAFWSRTYGRMFGADDPRDTRCTDEDNDSVTDNEDYCPYTPGLVDNFGCPAEAGNPPERHAFTTPPFDPPDSTLDAIVRFQERRFYDESCASKTGPEMLQQNYEDAAVMYFWEGDVQWISNGELYPALDGITAGLVILGAVVWVVLLLTWRDPALLIIPVGLLIMLLPSTLSVFYYNENPSFTRASGTIPFIFFLGALPLGMLLHYIVQAGRRNFIYYGIGIQVLLIFVYMASLSNYETYFNVYRESYEQSWLPYSEVAAPMKQFVEEENGSYGNAFYIHTSHWLDGRILALSAGDTDWMFEEKLGAQARHWPNGVFPRENIFAIILQNEGTPYAYDPTKPLMFYIHPTDIESIDYFSTQFPDGELRRVTIERKADSDFFVYVVPPGWTWMGRQMSQEILDLSCIINCRPVP